MQGHPWARLAPRVDTWMLDTRGQGPGDMDVALPHSVGWSRGGKHWASIPEGLGGFPRSCPESGPAGGGWRRPWSCASGQGPPRPRAAPRWPAGPTHCVSGLGRWESDPPRMVNKVAQSRPSRPPQAWRHQGSASERTSTALQGPRAALGALFTAAQEGGTRGRLGVLAGPGARGVWGG